MGVTVEVDNQRNCLVDVPRSNGGVCDNKLSVEGLPAKFLKIFYDISISLCMNELFVAACC